MTGRGKKAAAPKKKANGYKMPAPIPIGEVINDNIAKKKWRIGPSIGVGGFGEIYSACEHDNSPKKGSNYPFVVKIEPHENGPLFVEKHFYIRNANKEDVATFMKSKKLSNLGMPLYFGNGSHDFKGEKYRYLVLERYGKDVWSLFMESGRTFPTTTVFQLGLQMLDVLEYIHSRGYVHADLKGANILMGLKKGTENQAYLVDFGLANRVNEKEFKPDPKCAHNGTIEYTSRDAHLGVSTMRGDLEILGYNMLQWIVGELPWEKALKQPKTVQTLKEDFMNNVKSRITKDYPNVPDALIKFFEYINSMKPKETPDFVKCQTLFQNYLKKEGKSRSSKIEFTQSKKGKTKRIDNDDTDSDAPKVRRGRKPKPREPESDDENEQPESDAEENGKQNSKPKVILRRGKIPKTVIPESEDESEQPDSDTVVNGKSKVTVKRGKKPKTIIPESDDENEQSDSDVELNEKQNGNAPNGNLRRGRIPKTIVLESDDQNDEPSDDETAVKNKKRKSVEPAAVTRVKKTKVTPKTTPPAKKNHANIATQTSIDKRRSPRIAAHVDKVDKRQVSFDSPICEIIGHKKPSRNNSVNSDEDIFDDSFVIEEKKAKPKKKLLSDEEITVKRVIRKKTTLVKPQKGKSWKDCPTILNGRSAVPE